MVATASIKIDELLTSWLGSDLIYETVSEMIEQQKAESARSKQAAAGEGDGQAEDGRPPLSPLSAGAAGSNKSARLEIPTFYRRRGRDENPQDGPPPAVPQRRVRSSFGSDQTWDGARSSGATGSDQAGDEAGPSIAVQADLLFRELLAESTPGPQLAPIFSKYLSSKAEAYHNTPDDCRYIPLERFERLTKEICGLPTFFHKPLYTRILQLWTNRVRSSGLPSCPVVTYGIFRCYWTEFMAPYDRDERFFHLLRQPSADYLTRDDFFPYIKELLNDHPGLEFLSNHAEFQDKYAVTVITRIFYSVNLCHSGKITLRQIRKSDLVEVFSVVDEEEDINKVTRYFSYEHFYVLYCRFWELDHDRDYKITREDLLKYGEHSLSHIIVDRIFDAAPRPFEGEDSASSAAPVADGKQPPAATVAREYLTYEDFIFFMLSEEDKANEFSVRYWFTCVDVDGDDKLNNMEMRSFYAVQLHRMQCMGHEVVPFEDMLCQMIDMIKPRSPEYLVVEDFLQSHCSQVAGELFNALFNVNKYVMFEQRDPFLERQKREDEFETDWDRFACIDYNRLAMEEEQREEEAMEVDWVTMDEEEEDGDEYNSMGLSGSSEAPF